VPILLVGHLKPKMASGRNAALAALFRRLTAEGMEGLYLLRGEELLRGPEEGTVDGVHPSDLGFLQLAEAHGPVLEKLVLEELR
jgi:lysophospholipase L1-like esterase